MTGDQRADDVGRITVRQGKRGRQLYVIGPATVAQQFGLDGPRLSWKEWPDGKITDCRINGRKVSEKTLRAHWRRGDRTEGG